MLREVKSANEITYTITQNDVYVLQVQQCERLHIQVDKEVQATLLVHFEGCTNVNVNMIVSEAAQINVLYKYTQAMQIVEQTSITKDAKLQVAYYNLERVAAKHVLRYELVQSGASVHMLSSTNVFDEVVFDVECLHQVKYTSSKMDHYAIVHEGAHYEMQASGKIVKGAIGSKSHQSTRVLTTSKKQTTKATPLLLIDENDVEASHACSVGQMDENQLYYLQSRGLNKQESIALLTLSYFYPILKVLDGAKELQEHLLKEIEAKVGLTCSV